MNRRYLAILILIFTYPITGNVLGVECLSPGQFKEDFSFNNQIISNSLVKKERTGVLGNVIQPREPVANPGFFGRSFVGFNDKNIEFLAFAINPAYLTNLRRIEALARGKLFLDFAVDCGSNLNDSVTANISFQVKRLGRLSTFLGGANIDFGVTVRIWDTVENRQVYFKVIESTSVSNLLGNIKTIASVPVPLPDVQESVGTTIETFVAQLRRGRTYKFELFAAARATTGIELGPSVLATFARADFLDNFPAANLLNYNPGVELIDFSIDVANDQVGEIENLKKTVSSLQEALNALSEQFLDYNEDTRLQISELVDELAKQAESIRSLQEENTQLKLDVTDIQSKIDNLTQIINKLDDKFNNHTHEYLTVKGRGNNTINETTSTPVDN